MKKLFILLFPISVSSIFLALTITSENLPSTQDTVKLIGKWQLTLISDDKVDLAYKDFNECRKRDYIEYQDSIRIDHVYETLKSGCSKTVRNNNYSLSREYNQRKRHSYTAIIIGKGRGELEEIIVLNDSILKVSCSYGKVLKTYRRIN